MNNRVGFHLVNNRDEYARYLRNEMAKNRQMDNKLRSAGDGKKIKSLSKQKALFERLLELEEMKLKTKRRN